PPRCSRYFFAIFVHLSINRLVLRSRMAPLAEESVQEVVTAEGEEVELTPEQKKEKIVELMSAGKRELMAGNFDSASENFGQAAQFSAEVYGEFAAESFEPNFMYGRSMVELGAIENDMFQNALSTIKKKEGDMEEEAKGDQAEENDGNESMTEEERDEVRDMVADALAENAESLEKREEATEEEKKEDEAKVEETKEEEKVEETEEKKVEAKEEDKKVEEVKEDDKKIDETEDEKKESVVEKKIDDAKESSDEAATEEKTEKTDEKKEKAEEATDEEGEQMETEEKEDIGEEEEDGEDEEEEIASSQLAWETLEIASKIADMQYEETKLDAWKRKKADVLVQLAQCTANDEKYELALEDLGRARELLSEMESAKGDRLFAEIYFHEGRINRLRSEFAAAAESFDKAAAAMEVTMSVVKAAAGDAPTDEQKEELVELEAIIKDFKERAEDSKGSEVSKKMVEELAEKEKQPSILTTSNANSDTTANDISSLVRKKRAHDESEVEGAAKKAKSEEAEEKGDENIAV
ncbi:hypothetical protein PFISCL1PPCAC_7086, partial [Pristionchus fissidentatus]